MPIPLVDLHAQWACIRDEIVAAVQGCLDSMRFVLGPNGEAFEREFAAYCGTKHAVGVASGTDALHLALRAAGLGPGDEVITVSWTFIATLEAISHVGAVPVLADIRPDTHNMDPEDAARKITPRTRAIIPVHIYGLPADMDAIDALAREYGLVVIEDAAQAHGARYRGRRAGSLGDLACFSFYPSKNLGGYGDGGMVTTNSDEYAGRLRELRHHGHGSKYVHATIGYNSRLDEIQAAALRVKLRRLDDWNERRRAHAATYGRLLADADVQTPPLPDGCEHVFNLYTIRLAQRDALADRLARAEIGHSTHYRRPAHMQPAFAHLGYEAGSLPVTLEAAGQVIQLPLFPEMSPEQLDAVADVVKQSCPQAKHLAAAS